MRDGSGGIDVEKEIVVESLSLRSVTAPLAQTLPVKRVAALPQHDVAKEATSEPVSENTRSVKQSRAPDRPNTNMRFNLGGYDEEKLVIEIYNAEKRTLVRTIPYEAMSEKTKGLLLNVTA